MALPAQEEPITFLDSNHFLNPWVTPEASRHCVLHNCLGPPHAYPICLFMLPQAKECLGEAEAGKRKKGAFHSGFGRNMASVTPWFQTYGLQCCETIFCCPKPLDLWYFIIITAILEN